ncbi:MAG TPA: hypothetical protein VH933_04445 [Aestuariivirgaceae bacterium]|jgi:hypothetical protein
MVLLLAVWLWFGTTQSAYAYLDPGTGSILLQAVIGGVASGLFVIRLYWRKLRSLFSTGGDDEHSRSENSRRK